MPIMPFPMKIQPIDYSNFDTPGEPAHFEQPVKPVVKSRLKRLFELQFLRGSDKVGVGLLLEEQHFGNTNKKDDSGSLEFEPSSVCLDKMVQSFIEESNERSVKCGRNRCNCFNGICTDSSEEESDGGGFAYFSVPSPGEPCEFLKTLVPCTSVFERNLLADTARIVDKNKISKQKDEFARKTVTEGLSALGYVASICKSCWKKSSFYPAGEYEYIDVIVAGERLLVDIDFRSEFEIARSTKLYKSLLQTLPCIFVGKQDRLQKIVSIVSEAAKNSLKKKGMHVPPWRKPEYVKAKWFSPYTRTVHANGHTDLGNENDADDTEIAEPLFALSPVRSVGEGEVKGWRLPKVKPKSLQIGTGTKIATGLASVFGNEP